MLHRFAMVVALATLCLIFLGGLVKSTETGLSDPTWPQFNGGYEPQLRGSTFYEHLHRLVAGTVAALTVGLAVAAVKREPRRGVRALAIVATVGVLAQATFGGLTVLLQLRSLAVSMTHAGLAQAFLCATTALAVVTSPSWIEAAAMPRAALDRRLIALSTVTALAVFGQVLLGAWVRYTPSSAVAILDFPLSHGRLVPSLESYPVMVQYIHRLGALAVSVLAIATVARALSRHAAEPLVARPARLLAALLGAQVLLGGATIWTVKAVLPTTLHVAGGAALLACAVTLALRARRHAAVAPAPSESAEKRPSLAKDLATLTKARIAVFVVIAAATGFYLASPGPIAWTAFISGTVGAALLAASASALNQVVEREHDARMKRTADRPIPAGRIPHRAALALGLALGLAGVVVAAWGANTLTAALGLATLVSYVAIYTPMKRTSWLSTIVGAVPGAMPPVLGWAAARGELGLEAWTLFAIIFAWQLPHFYAIAWLYREDYARGGFPLLTVVEPDGASTARQVVIGSVALLGISLLPSAFGLTGNIYLAGAALLGVGFLALGFSLARTLSMPSARRVFLASLVYLPALFALMTLDKRA